MITLAETLDAKRISDGQLRELATVLWDYRAKLDRVEFLLEAQLLFSGSQRSGRLNVVGSLLDETATSIAELDLYRAMLLNEVAFESISLSELAMLTDEPWPTILRDHLASFHAVVRRIEGLVDRCELTTDTTLRSLAPIIEFIDHTTISDRSLLHAV